MQVVLQEVQVHQELAEFQGQVVVVEQVVLLAHRELQEHQVLVVQAVVQVHQV